MGMSLRSQNGAPQSEISQQVAHTVSGSFQALPYPPSLRGKVIYIRMSSNESISVRLTQETSGVVTIPGVLGTMLIEFTPDDRLTGVEVDGQATFEWSVFGETV